MRLQPCLCAVFVLNAHAVKFLDGVGYVDSSRLPAQGQNQTNAAAVEAGTLDQDHGQTDPTFNGDAAASLAVDKPQHQAVCKLVLLLLPALLFGAWHIWEGCLGLARCIGFEGRKEQPRITETRLELFIQLAFAITVHEIARPLQETAKVSLYDLAVFALGTHSIFTTWACCSSYIITARIHCGRSRRTYLPEFATLLLVMMVQVYMVVVFRERKYKHFLLSVLFVTLTTLAAYGLLATRSKDPEVAKQVAFDAAMGFPMFLVAFGVPTLFDDHMILVWGLCALAFLSLGLVYPSIGPEETLQAPVDEQQHEDLSLLWEMRFATAVVCGVGEIVGAYFAKADLDFSRAMITLPSATSLSGCLTAVWCFCLYFSVHPETFRSCYQKGSMYYETYGCSYHNHLLACFALIGAAYARLQECSQVGEPTAQLAASPVYCSASFRDTRLILCVGSSMFLCISAFVNACGIYDASGMRISPALKNGARFASGLGLMLAYTVEMSHLTLITVIPTVLGSLVVFETWAAGRTQGALDITAAKLSE